MNRTEAADDRPLPAGARILITGGAGFIGSHLADNLLSRGYRVRVLDSLVEQVHGPAGQFPGYLDRRVETCRGDVRDGRAVRSALADVDAVCHLAAAVGVGQSMYEIERYTDINNRGTAVLLEALLDIPVRRLMVASSMSVYGEGQYEDGAGRRCSPPPRTTAALRAGDWEPRSRDGLPLTPVPTAETKVLEPMSVYALSKYDQERLCLVFGRTYGLPVVALRFFNVYGERQALSNPYTGVLAVFASRLLNDRPPRIFEDGHQRRDFVSVHDVAEACALALEAPPAAHGHAINVGSGQAWTILEIAGQLGRILRRPDLKPVVRGDYRAGDIRHCFADITLAGALLGFRPRVTLDMGLAALANWLAGQIAEDRAHVAERELRQRGLVA